ncbi:MAG: UDP-N-acetylmuramoyl-L-alanine--D-glutamate ligase [Anaerolineae bacterium]|nr:UDP-N-acetylmuramoyl-L-alanine--D-glutamate ligase [Anaerolineae bacterium]
MARQGRALGRWLPTIGARVTLTDARPAEKLTDAIREFADHDHVTIVPGGHPLDLLDDCDLLCVSGGVPLTIPIIQAALARGIRVANDAQLFLERCPAPVIGITGSAGKTTTTALVGAMCRHWTDSSSENQNPYSPQRRGERRENQGETGEGQKQAATGRKTFVGGNIGDVLLDVLPQIAPEDRVVMELSSFQLDLITTSPPIATVLNLTPNHLDRHGTMAAYRAAKAHIYAHQTPDQIAVFGWDDPNAHDMSTEAPGRVAYFSMRERVTSGAYLDGAHLTVIGASASAGDPVIVCPRDSIQLRGDHNVLNVLAACAMAGAGGVPPESMRAAIASFTGEAHRMEPVATINGVTWINDSIATAPERVSAALSSYNEPIVLLAGGRDKDLPWKAMIALAMQTCRAVIAFGEYGPQIAAQMQRAQAEQPDEAERVRTITVSGLAEAVHAAKAIAQPGDVVLLSPGGTSYDAYQDFAARGQHFRDLVQALATMRDQ